MFKKGNIPWNKYKHLLKKHKQKISISMKGRKQTEEHVRNVSLGLKGRDAWNKGIPWSEEIKRKISLSNIGKIGPNKGKRFSKESRIKMGLSHKGKKRPLHSKYMKKLWKNKEYREKTIQATFKALHLTPNKPEKQLNKLLQKLFLKEYKYVGDGKVILGGFNPDFINSNGQKKIIELYGDYWHNKLDYIRRDKCRIKVYKKYGYKTLIIWQHELKNLNILKAKLLEFNTF